MPHNCHVEDCPKDAVVVLTLRGIDRDVNIYIETCAEHIGYLEALYMNRLASESN